MITDAEFDRQRTSLLAWYPPRDALTADDGRTAVELCNANGAVMFSPTPTVRCRLRRSERGSKLMWDLSERMSGRLETNDSMISPYSSMAFVSRGILRASEF